MTINLSLVGNKKFQDFLSLLQTEIELQKQDTEILKIVKVGIKYKNLLTIFGDDDEIGKYLQYSEKQKITKLKHISKQRIKDKKIDDEFYISEVTPDNILISADEFYKVRRYLRANYYSEDLFIFEYDEQKIQNLIKEFSKETVEKSSKLSMTDKKKQRTIHKIEIVRHENNTNIIKVVVNENYQLPLEVKLGKYWSKLYELAEKNQILNDKAVSDYFNSNLKNPLYAKLGYKQTQILKSDGAARIIPNIIIELITDKKITQRKNKTA